LNLLAGWKDINIKATCVSDPKELGGRINMQTAANTVSGSGVFSLTSDSDIEVKSTLGHINVEAIKDTDGWVSLKAAEDMYIQGADEVNIKSGTNMYHYAVNGVMNIKASGNILETGAEIHLNGPGAGSAADAAAASPVAADSAVIAAVGKPAYIAQTMTLLVTDLPNPVPSDPPLIVAAADGSQSADSHGLALNPNTSSGFGGENIRNLEDLLADMSSGVVAHTFTPSSNVGAQVLTGVPTTTSAGIWDGYSDELENDIYILGKRAFSNERRYLGWVTDSDKTAVTWNCTIDSTR
jgi:hypothetical protein